MRIKINIKKKDNNDINEILNNKDYDAYLNCGFEVNLRDDKLGLEGTMALIENKLGLII
jgi:hypothetical protein